MLTLIQEVHRREQEIVEKNQDLVEMKRKNQMVCISLIKDTYKNDDDYDDMVMLKMLMMIMMSITKL